MEITKTYSGDWTVDAWAIHGTTGSHFDLAAWVEDKGFQVEPDTDDMERSEIARLGDEDWDRRVIGEILGDSEAIVKIHQANQETT